MGSCPTSDPNSEPLSLLPPLDLRVALVEPQLQCTVLFFPRSTAAKSHIRFHFQHFLASTSEYARLYAPRPFVCPCCLPLHPLKVLIQPLTVNGVNFFQLPRSCFLINSLTCQHQVNTASVGEGRSRRCKAHTEGVLSFFPTLIRPASQQVMAML